MKSASFTFVTTGVADAVSVARRAAGDATVVIMGADIARQALIAGLVDEMQLQLVPILLGEGERLFDGVDPDRVEITQTRSVPTAQITHLFYSIKNKI